VKYFTNINQKVIFFYGYSNWGELSFNIFKFFMLNKQNTCFAVKVISQKSRSWIADEHKTVFTCSITISKLVFKIYQMRWYIRVKEKLRFIIIYKKTAKACLKCKHYQKVCDVKQSVSSVERDLHPLTGDCINGSTRSTKRKYLGTKWGEDSRCRYSLYFTGRFCHVIKSFHGHTVRFWNKMEVTQVFLGLLHLNPSVACMS
jgi:hypothetical protein